MRGGTKTVCIQIEGRLGFITLKGMQLTSPKEVRLLCGRISTREKRGLNVYLFYKQPKLSCHYVRRLWDHSTVPDNPRLYQVCRKQACSSVLIQAPRAAGLCAEQVPCRSGYSCRCGLCPSVESCYDHTVQLQWRECFGIMNNTTVQLLLTKLTDIK